MALESLVRLARDGKLFGPADAWMKDDHVVTADREILDNALDPLDSGLLIAEEFARLDLSDSDALVAWIGRRGTFDFGRTTVGYNALNIKSPKRVHFERAPREPEPEPQYGPPKPWEIILAERHAHFTAMVDRTSIEKLRADGWTADPLEKIRTHQEQVRDWLPALVDHAGEPDAWVLGAYLPDLVSDALSAFIVDEAELVKPGTIGHQPGGVGEWTVEVWWESVLQPIYLQLFIAFRRAERGVPAAARCRACGEIFLILDGRRSTYCNAKCRNRYNVRAFRERAKVEAQS